MLPYVQNAVQVAHVVSTLECACYIVQGLGDSGSGNFSPFVLGLVLIEEDSDWSKRHEIFTLSQVAVMHASCSRWRVLNGESLLLQKLSQWRR